MMVELIGAITSGDAFTADSGQLQGVGFFQEVCLGPKSNVGSCISSFLLIGLFSQENCNPQDSLCAMVIPSAHGSQTRE